MGTRGERDSLKTNCIETAALDVYVVWCAACTTDSLDNLHESEAGVREVVKIWIWGHVLNRCLFKIVDIS